jgi:hypothetical protein
MAFGCAAAEQRDELASFQPAKLHLAPNEARPGRAATPAASLPLDRARPTLLATCNGGTIAGTHTPLKPAFLARQLATSADLYLLASGRLLCESRVCRGGDQNNRSRQCTQKNERAHDFLLSRCHLQVGQLPIVFLPSGDSIFIRLAATEATTRRSFCLNFSARELDQLAPLLDFFSDEPVEVGRRAGKRRATELGNPCLRPRIGKSGVSRKRDLTPPCAVENGYLWGRYEGRGSLPISRMRG